MGRAALLFVPGPLLSVPHHGVPPRWRSHDDAHQVRHVLGGRDPVLHCGVCACYRGRPPTRLHPPVRITNVLSPSHLPDTAGSDIKPDNILIDKDGHIKLMDFPEFADYVASKTETYDFELEPSGKLTRYLIDMLKSMKKVWYVTFSAV